MSISTYNRELLNKMNSTASRVQLGTLVASATLVAYDSAASAGGAVTEALTVTGLAAGDTILAVSQKTQGANGTAITAWSSQGNNTLTIRWTANPGAGAVVTVLVRKA